MVTTRSGARKEAPKHDPATTFRGDPQPPVNDRLGAANIFLADEDIDRNLHFERRLDDIDEYVEHVEKHSLECDLQLLNDVKTKAKVHHEWQESRAQGLPSGCVCPTETPTRPAISSRLLDAETAAKITKRRREVGLDQHVRDDHAPFTTVPERDDNEFRQALLKAATKDASIIDPEKTLFTVENRAFEDALEDPALIPYWMHPTKGLPTAGVRGSEDRPIPRYKSHVPTEIENNRPPRSSLPDYLQARENEINRLIRNPDLSIEQFKRLEELLRLHEPLASRKLYEKWQELRAKNNYQHDDATDAAREDYFDSRDKWLDTFRSSGVYLMNQTETPRSTQPGVFYLPGSEIITNEQHAQVRQDQIRLDAFMAQIRHAGGFMTVWSSTEYHRLKLELAQLLHPFASGALRQRKPDFYTQLDIQDERILDWIDWISLLVHSEPQIILLRPGEMELGDPSLLYIPWHPVEPSGSQLPTPSSPSTFDAHRILNLQALIQRKRDPRFPLSNRDVDTFADLLVSLQPIIMSRPDFSDELLGPREGHDLMDDNMSEEMEWARVDALVRDFGKRALSLKKEVAATAAKSGGMRTAAVDAFHALKKELLDEWWTWYSQVRPNAATLLERKLAEAKEQSEKLDFTGKAQRRGVQRAAIQLGLNILATNEEQHQPDDNFRMVKLQPPYVSPPKEVPLSLPLEPWKRPKERDTFEFTKKLAAYHRAKDLEYQIGRIKTIENHPGELQAPENYNGPLAVADGTDFKNAARDRQKLLQFYYSLLSEAQQKSPRPLLQQMLHQINWALISTPETGQLALFPRLRQEDLDLLEEISEESWDEQAQPYDSSVLFGNESGDFHRFLEFERDVRSTHIFEDVPFWQPADEDIPSSRDMYIPVPYDPILRSEVGLTVDELVQRIGDMRLEEYRDSPLVHLWTKAEALVFLRGMARFFRIHLDEENGESRISRIPLTGHPENRYVTSVESAPAEPGIYQTANGTMKVRYNAAGWVGPPIVQPNKYEHFHDLAERLGREIRECLETQKRDTRSWSISEGYKEQMEAMSDALNEASNLSDEDYRGLSVEPVPDELHGMMETLALELNEYAPDLAREAGFDWSGETSVRFPHQGSQRQKDQWTEQRLSEYAAVIQMKVLEESNNNWESRFPEQEHIWDFAADRVEPTFVEVNGRRVEVIPSQTQFFSMRRWPVDCQSEATQAMINQSGPLVSTKPEPEMEVRDTRTPAEKMRDRQRMKVDRHISNQEPCFPFGENPYQQAFLSYRMELDLKDVPEFQPPQRSWYERLRERRRARQRLEPFSLPSLPKGWNPDNVSLAEKQAYLLKYAKNTPGFPDPSIPEYYHTQEEIEWLRQYTAQWERQNRTRAEEQALEDEIGRPLEKASGDEIREARERLGAGLGRRAGISKDPRKPTASKPPSLGVSGNVARTAKRTERSDAQERSRVKRTRFAEIS